MSKYSTLRNNQEILIVKTPETGKPFIVARCHTEAFAELVCHLLEKAEKDAAQEEKPCKL